MSQTPAFFGWSVLAIAMLFSPAAPGAEPSSRLAVNLGYGSVHYSAFSFVGTGKDLSGRGHSFQGAVEWLPFNERFGTIGLGVGFGLYQSGKIVTISKDAPTEAERKIHRLGDGETVSRSNNLVTIPLGTYVSYHGRFVPGQIVVPFVRFGPSMTIARQISRSGAPKANGKFFGIDYAAGLELYLDGIDGGSAQYLQRGVGIRETYLVAEYARSDSLGVDNSDFINLRGDSIRIALRFQF